MKGGKNMDFKGKGCKNKGITLIALVITIIVLLILAGVTIMMLMGSENAPQKASEAVEKDAIAGAKDEVAMEAQSALLDYFNKKYVEGSGTDSTSIQSEVAKAAKKAVDSAKSKNKQLLSDSGVTDNTITLKTKSYTVTGTIDENGSITWGDIVASTGGTGEETSTTRTVQVDSFSDLNNKASLPSDENTIVKKGTGENEQQVVIPAGFIQATDSADTLEDGLVIEDASEDLTKKGNQFVWIPVGQKLNWGTVILGRYCWNNNNGFNLTGPHDGDVEIRTSENGIKATESSNSVARNIEEFLIKTNEARGYYIGRYEMGIEGANVDTTTKQWEEESPGSKNVVCQVGKTVYNCISRDDAVEESQKLYNDVKKGKKVLYTSDLINSFAWDSALYFMSSGSISINGLPYSNGYKSGRSEPFLTGGAGQSCKKICDIRGNVVEWSTEVTNNAKRSYIARGGSYSATGTVCETRSVGNGLAYNYIGFRAILYIVSMD